MSSPDKYLADGKVETGSVAALAGTIRTETKCCNVAAAPHIADRPITPVGGTSKEPSRNYRVIRHSN